LDKRLRTRISVVFLPLWVILTSCATRLPVRSFRVVPATPEYQLRSPDSLQTPFPQILRHYNGFEPGRGWMDLRPEMELRIENAYYQPGIPRRGLDGFLGTEVARYKVRANGRLQLQSVQSMKHRPNDQPPVQQLMGTSQRHYGYHRFYYAIIFRRAGNARGSVLLGANAKEELDRLATELLADPQTVCFNRSTNCTVFPEACSVSIEMEIVVNGIPQNVIWDSSLASVVDHPQHLELLRLYDDRLTPVKLDPSDREALQLPLLPGDHINWAPATHLSPYPR
jgi:hypothetical protein